MHTPKLYPTLLSINTSPQAGTGCAGGALTDARGLTAVPEVGEDPSLAHP